jgi:hypothetical protein
VTFVFDEVLLDLVVFAPDFATFAVGAYDFGEVLAFVVFDLQTFAFGEVLHELVAYDLQTFAYGEVLPDLVACDLQTFAVDEALRDLVACDEVLQDLVACDSAEVLALDLGTSVSVVAQLVVTGHVVIVLETYDLDPHDLVRLVCAVEFGSHLRVGRPDAAEAVHETFDLDLRQASAVAPPAVHYKTFVCLRAATCGDWITVRLPTSAAHEIIVHDLSATTDCLPTFASCDYYGSPSCPSTAYHVRSCRHVLLTSSSVSYEPDLQGDLAVSLYEGSPSAVSSEMYEGCLD